jgi:poly-beta-1,6-N-acetyl-D-glucosamine synthase
MISMGKITALVPAHNEQDTIEATVVSLQKQLRPPDRIIVVCDNCSDRTEEVAQACGVDTYVTVENTEMKAGGLNQALHKFVLSNGDDNDLVACVDADSIVGENFLSEAIARFNEHSLLGGASGTYHGRKGGGYVGWCQRNEFARWGFDNRKEHGHTVILSGAASVFRVAALRTVVAARANGSLGGEGVYDSNTITEDFELSLALRTTGSTIVNMLNVHIETAVKPTWRTLFTQRLRWDRGINESLVDYGITKVTRIVWLKRVMYAVFVPISFLVLGLFTWRLIAGGGMSYATFWLLISLIMASGRGFTIVRMRGCWNGLLAFLLVFELAYDTFLQCCFVRALWDQATSRSAAWR